MKVTSHSLSSLSHLHGTHVGLWGGDTITIPTIPGLTLTTEVGVRGTDVRVIVTITPAGETSFEIE